MLKNSIELEAPHLTATLAAMRNSQLDAVPPACDSVIAQNVAKGRSRRARNASFRTLRILLCWRIMIEITKPLAVSQLTAAKLLEIDRRKIAAAVRNGELPSFQNGVAVRIAVTDLEAWLRSWPRPKARKPRAKKGINQ